MKIYWVQSKKDLKNKFFINLRNAADFTILDTIEHYGTRLEITKQKDLRFESMSATPDSNGDYTVYFSDIETGVSPFVVSYIHSATTED